MWASQQTQKLARELAVIYVMLVLQWELKSSAWISEKTLGDKVVCDRARVSVGSPWNVQNLRQNRESGRCKKQSWKKLTGIEWNLPKRESMWDANAKTTGSSIPKIIGTYYSTVCSRCWAWDQTVQGLLCSTFVSLSSSTSYSYSMSTFWSSSGHSVSFVFI